MLKIVILQESVVSTIYVSHEIEMGIHICPLIKVLAKSCQESFQDVSKILVMELVRFLHKNETRIMQGVFMILVRFRQVLTRLRNKSCKFLT